MIIDQGVLFWLIVVFFVRNPRRANAKELRRAYERARQELKTIELEARPKSDRKPDLHAIEQAQLRRERRNE